MRPGRHEEQEKTNLNPSHGMQEKQRFLGTMLGRGADRFPFFDLAPSDETVARWRREGLPGDTSVGEYFKLEQHYDVGVMLRSHPFYKGAPGLLQDPSLVHKYFNPDEPSRYPRKFGDRARKQSERGKVVYVNAGGGGLLQMLGVNNFTSFTNAMYALIEQPDRVEALVDKISDVFCICLERVLSTVSVEYVSFYEPIASYHGPVISPAMFERFAVPGYRKVLALLRRFDVPLAVFCTTGGDVSRLLPPLIEAGINALWISNIRKADMNYLALRRAYGPEIALIGGIESAALLQDRAAIRRAVENIVPPLLEQGRYIPCLDDRPRSNVAFAQYRYYRQLLQEYV